jgi:hypothetical protein
MHPPWEAVENLERLESTARLAWFPDPQKAEGELNAGAFALLQLYPRAKMDEILYEPWGDKGPVFGSTWNNDKYYPAWLANFTKEQVFSGSFILDVRRWMRPLKERVVESAQELGREKQARMRDMAEEAGDRMYHKAQKSLDRPPVLAKKFVSEEDKAILSGDAQRDYTEDFMPRSESEL